MDKIRIGLTPKLTDYIPHEPTARQTAFLLLCDILEVFFGGAAGGGKSDALLMAALQYVDCPDYAAIIFRDSYTNLSQPNALMEVATDWLGGTDVLWKEKAKTWIFPTGATLTFGSMDKPKDHLKYKGAEFQFIGFDEASDLKWKHIMYMFSRLRKKEVNTVPLRFRLASNPGGISHNKIKKRYINPLTRRKDTIFIPSKLQDNP
ncbi:terminase family protein, partial [bacterium]|nr:terminase family protein [bacterium]